MEDKDKAANQGADNNPPQPPLPKDKATVVEVLVDNLGPNLLKKGERTSDPDAVALLKRKGQKLVREVK